MYFQVCQYYLHENIDTDVAMLEFLNSILILRAYICILFYLKTHVVISGLLLQFPIFFKD